MEINENILDTYFNLRQDDLAQAIDLENDSLKKALKQVSMKQIRQSIELLPKEYEEIKNQIYSYMNDITANYEIKKAYYEKEYYKQGFHDAIMINCCCKEKEELAIEK